MTSTSAPMPCWAQKSSISCVSAIPPIIEPAYVRRPPISDNTCRLSGSAGAPTLTSAPSTASSDR
jgi:hypothetical protein